MIGPYRACTKHPDVWYDAERGEMCKKCLAELSPEAQERHWRGVDDTNEIKGRLSSDEFRRFQGLTGS